VEIGIVGDFNAENLGRMLEKHCGPDAARISIAPFGQAMQTLLRPSAEFWSRSYDLIVLWTFPTSIVARFSEILDFGGWEPDELDQHVDAFVEVVRQLEARGNRVFIPLWTIPPGTAHGPAIEMQPGVGATAALLHMNAHLVEHLTGCPGVVVFNTERWLGHAGPTAVSDKLWYLSKTPYPRSVFEEAARDMTATLRGMAGLRRKVVVLDLDNTLWGGIVGDLGWEAIQLGGHDPIGEAYRQFQRELRSLTKQGVILAIASKNEEAIAFDAIDKHPEMILRRSDFAAWRINWKDKAQNIVELMVDLNLSPDSAVFLDDNPHERNRIRQALPEVLVPEWPSDPMDYANALRALRCFESPSLSSEDRARTAMYVSDRKRKGLQAEVETLEKWLEMLELEVHAEPLSSSNLERTSQVLNKTNQMNLTTRRLSAQELVAWASDEHHQIWTFSVKDKIGDYGLCGVASLTLGQSRASLVDFVLSCRAMGRGVEDAIISVIAVKVRAAGVESLTASYVPTKKNKPCIRWIEQRSSFMRQGDGVTFLLDVNGDIRPPKHIRVTVSS
jgi:FkbH-like protein